MDPFIIKIENQRWLYGEEEDYCSHGDIYLSINGTVLTQSGMDEDWGISESALALLRTVEKDYQADPINNVGLILHGCGTILMTGCPISIHWSVTHVDDHIILTDFVKISSTDPQSGTIEYPDLQVNMKKSDYKKQVLQFAHQVMAFFQDSRPKRFFDNDDRKMYDEFWNEFNLLVTKLSQ